MLLRIALNFSYLYLPVTGITGMYPQASYRGAKVSRVLARLPIELRSLISFPRPQAPHLSTEDTRALWKGCWTKANKKTSAEALHSVTCYINKKRAVVSRSQLTQGRASKAAAKPMETVCVCLLR